MKSHPRVVDQRITSGPVELLSGRRDISHEGFGQFYEALDSQGSLNGRSLRLFKIKYFDGEEVLEKSSKRNPRTSPDNQFPNIDEFNYFLRNSGLYVAHVSLDSLSRLLVMDGLRHYKIGCGEVYSYKKS